MDKVFDDIPEIQDLLPSGGRPGFEYAIIAAQNIIRAQREGWSTIDRLDAFEIKGPLGTCPAVLVGRGGAIYGASSQAHRVPTWLDRTVSDSTGLWLPGDEPKEEKAPAPKNSAAKASGPSEAGSAV